MIKAFLGIGTNLGDRQANINDALSSIGKNIGRIERSSSVYETEPWGFQADNKFLNMVTEVATSLKPSGILGAILMIEAQLGRMRSGKQYTSRIIDIDILFFGDLIIDEVSLKIPHPLIPERKFVLVPLCEIAPDMIHPSLKVSMTHLLDICKDSSNISKYIPL